MIDEKEVNDFLEHFGVKGMRWGVRRRNSSNENRSSRSKTSRNLGLIGAGGILAAGAAFAARTLSRRGNIPVSQASRHTNVEAAYKLVDVMDELLSQFQAS